MGRQIWHWLVMGIAVLLVGGMVLAWPFAKPDENGTMALVPPTFFKEALAESEAVGASIVEQEAGIAAYFKADTAIDLSLARDAFRTIESETADYMIGSVDVPEFGEWADVHVYLHKDGWFLAYYLKNDPTAKFINFPQMTGPTIITTFETVMALVADAAGTAAKPLTYYDFRYPNANQILFVYEDENDGDTFGIKLPSDYVYYERSVSATHRAVSLDSVDLETVTSIPATALAPDVFHEFRIRCCNGGRMVLVLTYRVE